MTITVLHPVDQRPNCHGLDSLRRLDLPKMAMDRRVSAAMQHRHQNGAEALLVSTQSLGRLFSEFDGGD